MMPRPRSRRKPLEIVDHRDLLDDIQAIRQDGGSPVAIVTGPREWIRVRLQVGFRHHAQFWPGGEETFDGVAVIIQRNLGAPRVMADQGELEEVLLPG